MLIIVRGLPGSGKSTYARTSFPNILHLEQDMFLYRDRKYCYSKSEVPNAVKWCYDTTKTALKNHMDVIVSNTFIYKKHVDHYVNLAKELGAKYKIVRLKFNYGSIHDVPMEVLKSMSSRFEDYPGEIIFE